MNNVLQFKSPKTRLHIFAGKLGPYADRDTVALYNIVFEFWQTYWSGVMAEIGSKLPPAEEFFRQDLVLAVLDHSKPQPEVAALLGVNQYNLETAIREHEYLKQYGQEFFSRLADRKVRNVWSGQFLTANAAYSPRVTRMSYAAIILGAMHRLYEPWAASDTAMIGVARNDNGSCNNLLKFGWEVIGAPITLHNVPVSQVALVGPPRAHKDNPVNVLINQYWKERADHESGYSKENSSGSNVA